SVTSTVVPTAATETLPTGAATASTQVAAPAAKITSLKVKTTLWVLEIAMRGSTVIAPPMGCAVLRTRSRSPPTGWFLRELALTRARTMPEPGVTLTLPEDGPVPKALVAFAEQL